MQQKKILTEIDPTDLEDLDENQKIELREVIGDVGKKIVKEQKPTRKILTEKR